MESQETVFQLSAFFTGHVQGVGFRYATKQVANGFEVTGFVRNLPDGRVELRAEGEEMECRRFLREVQSELDSYIRDTDSRESAGPRTHFRFGIA